MEFFGISGSEFLIILVIVVLIMGPETIAQALRAFATAINKGKEFSARLREETKVDLSNTGFDDVDWSAFDLSGLDPRQMIREAVQEEMQAWAAQTNLKGQVGTKGQSSSPATTSPTQPEPKQPGGTSRS